MMQGVLPEDILTETWHWIPENVCMCSVCVCVLEVLSRYCYLSVSFYVIYFHYETFYILALCFAFQKEIGTTFETLCKWSIALRHVKKSKAWQIGCYGCYPDMIWNMYITVHKMTTTCVPDGPFCYLMWLGKEKPDHSKIHANWNTASMT